MQRKLEEKAYGATTVLPSASVSRRSRGNAGRLEASHTAPYVFFRGAKVVSCALKSIMCQCRQCRLECTGAHRETHRIKKSLTCSPARMTAQPFDMHSPSSVQPQTSLIGLQEGHGSCSSLLVQKSS